MASKASGVTTSQRDLHICASGLKASVKQVDFRYNGTGGRLANLEVLRIADKTYENEESKPLWAVEHSYERSMRFEPLWGIVDPSYETTDGFHSLRKEELWLPTNPHQTLNFGEKEGYDSLAGATGYIRILGNLYRGTSIGSDRDYSGKNEFALLERLQKLSEDSEKVSQIPNLILTDRLAAVLVGTKTAISTKYIGWPASLAVDNTSRGFPKAEVTVYRRVIHYDLRYAIPGLLVLATMIFALVWALGIFFASRVLPRSIRNLYNQTSTGRLAVNLLHNDGRDPTEPTQSWLEEDGKTILSFGYILTPVRNYFCKTREAPLGSEPSLDEKTSGSDSLLGPTREGDNTATNEVRNVPEARLGRTSATETEANA